MEDTTVTPTLHALTASAVSVALATPAMVETVSAATMLTNALLALTTVILMQLAVTTPEDSVAAAMLASAATANHATTSMNV